MSGQERRQHAKRMVSLTAEAVDKQDRVFVLGVSNREMHGIWHFVSIQLPVF